MRIVLFLLYFLLSTIRSSEIFSEKLIKKKNTKIYQLHGIQTNIDRYNNHHIEYSEKIDTKKLTEFVLSFKKSHPEIGLYIHQSPQIAIDRPLIKKLGFDFAEYDRTLDKILWLMDNNRGITHFGSTTTGAGIIVKNKEGQILLILNPDIDTWVFPSGGTDRNELLRDGAIRELKEEVSLEGKREDLNLIFITNNLRPSGREEMNSINFFYTLEKYTGTAKKSKEAPEIIWIHPKKLLGKTSLIGKKIHPLAPRFVEILTKENSCGSALIRIKNMNIDTETFLRCKKNDSKNKKI